MALDQTSFFETWKELTGTLEHDPLIVVGFSGGCDSWALLHILHSLNVKVIAAHLHHGMREEATKEAQELEEECTKMGAPFILGRANVPEIAKSRRIGIEEAGRDARYSFLRQVVQKSNATAFVTAHTNDDQIETFFLHAIRGSGLTGIGGMKSVQGQHLRPFLGITRQETESYCKTRALPVLNDPGNENLDFSRVRIRKQVIPQLAIISSGFQKALSRSMEIWREEDEFLNALAAHAVSHCVQPLNGNLNFLTIAEEIALIRSEYLKQNEVLRKRMVILIASYFDAHFHSDQIQQIAGSQANGSGSVTSLFGNLICSWKNDLIHFQPSTQPAWGPVSLEPDTTHLALNQSWKISCQESVCNTQSRRTAFSVVVGLKHKDLRLCQFDQLQGATMTPLGFDHRRKVSDLLSEAKLTLLARSVLPILFDQDGPLWIPGVCLDQRAALPLGEQGLELIFKPNVSN